MCTGGIGEIDMDGQEDNPDNDNKDDNNAPEPMAAHGLNEDTPHKPQDPDALEQQAGPRGVASNAPTARSDKAQAPVRACRRFHTRSRTHANRSHSVRMQCVCAHVYVCSQKPSAADMQQQQLQSAAPEPAPTSAEDAAGADGLAPPPPPTRDDGQARPPPSGAAADAAADGAIAPMDPGAAGPTPKPPPAAPRRPEPNPLRDLGDAMERWKASLNVQHDIQTEPDVGKLHDTHTDMYTHACYAW